MSSGVNWKWDCLNDNRVVKVQVIGQNVNSLQSTHNAINFLSFQTR